MSKTIKITRTVKDLRKQIAKWRDAGKTVALVPTMGALHDGHLALVKLAKKKAGRAVVSIFVNPTQFAANEDLSRYPRDEAADVKKLISAEADLVFAPTAAEMYPDGFSTSVLPGSAAEGMEGAVRPHHFGGVATVCCKLFSQTAPDLAIFGEKDYQQLTVLKQMVRDLNLPLKIIGAPTERASDGLALSSRNAYLTAQERAAAPALYAALVDVAKAAAKGEDLPACLANAKRKILAAGFSAVDYIDVRDAETLAAPRAGYARRVLAAARIGKTRLVDNTAVKD